MDLHAAAADGIVGFTHKATEATWIKHVHTGEALARARDAGMEFVGAYHVVRSTSPAEQVDYFLAYLDQVASWWRTFPGFFLQVDLEIWDYDRVTAATGMEFARLLVAAQPKRVITYASRGQYGDSLAGIVTPLWNANYGSNPVAHYPAAYPGDGSSRWTAYSGQVPVFLQYGSQLTIGTQPGCDANAFRGTLDDLRALISGSAPVARKDDDMFMVRTKDGSIYFAPGFSTPSGKIAAFPFADEAVYNGYKAAGIVTVQLPGGLDPAFYELAPQPWPSGAGLTPEEIAQVSGAAHDGAAGAIDGATVSGAVISTKKP
jgi:GH25 family lysozyme M1 (1,4-beta-N-acetylmuramidase)